MNTYRITFADETSALVYAADSAGAQEVAIEQYEAMHVCTPEIVSIKRAS
jgi:hypothetical protein